MHLSQKIIDILHQMTSKQTVGDKSHPISIGG